MTQSAGNNWRQVRAEGPALEKYLDKEKRRISLDFRSFCIVCGGNIEQPGLPEEFHHAQEFTVRLTDRLEGKPVKTPVVTRLYLCKQHKPLYTSQMNLEKWTPGVILFFYTGLLLAGVVIAGASDLLPAPKLLTYFAVLTTVSALLYFLILLISRKIYRNKFLDYFSVTGDGESGLIFHLHPAGNAEKAARTFGFKTYDPVMDEQAAVVEKQLLGLPIVPAGRVPQTRRPFQSAGFRISREFCDVKSAARHFLHLYPPHAWGEYIRFNERGGGMSQWHDFYRIEESTWVLTEDYELTD
jgi:hypothetical protein